MIIQLSDHFTYKKLLRFTLPSIAMMIFTSIYGVVDGFFVSNYAGDIPFKAVNLIMPFLMIVATVGFMFGTGGTAIVANTLGVGDHEKANRYFSLFVYVTFTLGVIFAALAFAFMRPIAELLGARGEILECCVLYGRIIVCALPLQVLQYLFQSFFVAAEKPKLGLAVIVAAGVTNMVLDAVLVILLLFRSDIGNYLMLDRAAILHGQIWRLITFVFIPQGTVGSSISLVLTLLQIYFLYFAGKALENAWGQFKLTVFTLAGMLGCILACLLLPGASVLSQMYGMIAMSAFQSAFVFAFACVYPEAPLLFMFVIPLPAKYLGILEALLMGRDVISVGRTVLSFSRLFGVGALVAGAMLLVSLLLGLLGFWLFAVPVLWNNYKARQRRNQWKNQWK